VFDSYYSSATGTLIPDYRDISVNNVHVLGTGGLNTFRGWDAAHPIGITLNNVVFDEAPMSITPATRTSASGRRPSPSSPSGTGVVGDRPGDRPPRDRATAATRGCPSRAIFVIDRRPETCRPDADFGPMCEPFPGSTTTHSLDRPALLDLGFGGPEQMNENPTQAHGNRCWPRLRWSLWQPVRARAQTPTEGARGRCPAEAPPPAPLPPPPRRWRPFPRRRRRPRRRSPRRPVPANVRGSRQPRSRAVRGRPELREHLVHAHAAEDDPGQRRQTWSIAFFGTIEADYITDSTRSYNEIIGGNLVARGDTYEGTVGRTQFSMRTRASACSSIRRGSPASRRRRCSRATSAATSPARPT
jgi:hypothetical protein